MQIFLVFNWKMNKMFIEVWLWVEELIIKYVFVEGVDFVVLVLVLDFLVLVVNFLVGIVFGGQDVLVYELGVYIGEISVVMLKDVGVSCVVVGYFECCEYYDESDVDVVVKVCQVQVNGLLLIVCVGENLDVCECGEYVLQMLV